jgi:hypothetical protein
VVVFDHLLLNNRGDDVGYLAMIKPPNAGEFHQDWERLCSEVFSPPEITSASIRVNETVCDVPCTKGWNDQIQTLAIGRSSTSKFNDTFKDPTFRRIEAYAFLISKALVLVCPADTGDGGPYWTASDDDDGASSCFTNSASVINSCFDFTIERPREEGGDAVVKVTLEVFTEDEPATVTGVSATDLNV